MAKVHRDTCMMQTLTMIKKEVITDDKSERAACKKVADELGVRVNTIRTWWRRAKEVDSGESTQKGIIKRPSPYYFYTLSSGDSLVDFGTYDEKEEHILVIRQSKMKDGKRLYTDRIDIPEKAIARLKETIDRAVSGPLFDDELRERLFEEAKEGCDPGYLDQHFYQTVGIDSVSPPIIIKPTKVKSKKLSKEAKSKKSSSKKPPSEIGSVKISYIGFREWLQKIGPLPYGKLYLVPPLPSPEHEPKAPVASFLAAATK